MMSLSTRAGPSTSTPSDGSRTITIRDSQPREDNGGERSDDNGGHRGNDGTSTVGVLRLRGAPRSQPRVAWKEDVVDNEGMGKKKSKICCIYHRPKRFDESSSESDSSSDSSDDGGNGSGSGSDSGRAQPTGRLRNHRQRHSRRHHDHNHNHDHDCNEHGSGTGGGSGGGVHSSRSNGNGSSVQTIDPDEPDVNAYERQPKSKKGKAVEH